MKKNLFSTTFAFLVFPFCTTFFPSSLIQENFPKEIISPNTIVLELTQASQNFSLPLEKKGINTLQLCNLENDKNYQLLLSGFEKSCDEQIYFLENPNEITRHLQIEGSDNCYEILIQNSCDLEENITLLVKSFLKKKEATQKPLSAVNLVPIITD